MIASSHFPHAAACCQLVDVDPRTSPPGATRNVHEGKLSVWPPTRDPLLQLLTVWPVKTAHFEKL